MNMYDMQAAIRDVSCPPYSLALRSEPAGGGTNRYYLQVSAMLPDNTAQGEAPPVILEQKGRKWWLSPHMTKSEVVSTCLKAILTFEEHEIRERFKYRGRAVYDPHYDVDVLHAIRSRADALSERAPMPAKTDRAGAMAEAEADMLRQLAAVGEIHDHHHGWVVPRRDGAKAKCGGPEMCEKCRADERSLNAHKVRISSAARASAPLMGDTLMYLGSEFNRSPWEPPKEWGI